MAEEIKFPARILALAEQVKGNPIAYSENDERIVIVFEDGRKLTFFKDKVTGETEAVLHAVGFVAPAAQSPKPSSTAKTKSKRKE